MIFKNGNIYEGNFKENKIEGKGKMILNDWDYYEGYFLNGKFHG
jgi:hypothetical protein